MYVNRLLKRLDVKIAKESFLERAAKLRSNKIEEEKKEFKPLFQSSNFKKDESSSSDESESDSEDIKTSGNLQAVFLSEIITYEIYPKTAVTEIGPRDLIYIQTSKWPKYFSLSFWAILKFECMSTHVVLSLSQQFWAVLRYILYESFDMHHMAIHDPEAI